LFDNFFETIRRLIEGYEREGERKGEGIAV